MNTLIDLKKAFDAADQDGSGALDESEFIAAFRNVKGIKGYDTEEQLCHLFMKIDANSDGTVDWDEFTNHILLEQSRYMATEDEELNQSLYEGGSDDHGSANDAARPSEKKKEAITSASERIENKAYSQHIDMIEKIMWVPGLKSYLSAGRDGFLKLWSDKLLPQKMIRNGNGWITDVALMGSQPMAVCSNDRIITFYDSCRSSLDMLGRIINLDNVPLCCEYIRQTDHDLFIYADDRGFMHPYVLEDQWGSEVSGPSAEAEIGIKKLSGMKTIGPIQVHTDWVTQFKQQKQSTTLDLITSSMDCQLKLFDLEKKETKWSVTGHNRGVYGFDVCKAYDFIASCGVERDIMLWNPYTGTSIGVLTGHTASVQKVIVNDDDNQLISLSTDKVIKIWDLRSNKCMQTIIDKEDYWPENRITSIMYNRDRRCIVTGAVKLKEKHRIKKSEVQASNPIIFALFNSGFGQVVTGDKMCFVNVYNVDNGEKVFAFDEVHGNITMSAWSFDNTGRRLLTGGQDGTLKMWNFNNGQCLKTFHGFGEDEITCVAYVQEGGNRYVAAGGWNSKVCIWEDTNHKREHVLRTLEGHSDDVSCMCFCSISTAAVILATGSYDGEVILWKLDGIVKNKLTYPSTPQTSMPGSTTMETKSIERLWFLPKRDNKLLALRIDGVLLCWKVSDGSLVGSAKLEYDHFHKNKDTEVLRLMCVDDECEMLFTADSAGYVVTWDLYLGGESEEREASDALVRRQFCFRAHQKAITSIEYVTKLAFILTASADGTTKLWTTNGIRIGDFGQARLWRLHAWSTYAERESYHVNLDEDPSGNGSDTKEDVQDDASASSNGAHNHNDNIIENEDAYYLEQQRMNFFGAGRKDVQGRRRRRNMNFDLVLQRRLPLKSLSPVEPPKSTKHKK